MRAEQFAEFWRRQGHRVVETASCFWYNAQPFSFLSIPYHRDTDPASDELARVFFGGPALAARFFPADGSEPNRGLFVCSERDYSLSSLDKKARNQTRRGLENCTVEEIHFDYLADHGQAINLDTSTRQGRSPQVINERQWRRYCQAAAALPDFEAWGAFVRGQLAAFMVTALVEDWLNILHQASATGALPFYPNNALTFTVTSLKLACPQVAGVSYGLKSLEDTSRLDHFKLQMGYRLKPRGDRVVLHPLLRPLVRLGGKRFIEGMAKRHPASDFWRKAACILTP